MARKKSVGLHGCLAKTERSAEKVLKFRREELRVPDKRSGTYA